MLNSKSVFLSATYSAKKEVRALADTLWREGIPVCSSWHLEPYGLDCNNLGYSENRAYACASFVEVQRCDMFVFLTCLGDSTHGGMDREFGFAYALGKPIYIVGNSHCIFDTLPCVTRNHDNIDGFASWLVGEM